MSEIPKVKVRREEFNDYGTLFWALVVEQCPYCGKEHFHVAGMKRTNPVPKFLGESVGAKCDGMNRYILAG